MKIIDISPLISEAIAVFPGDTPFTRNWLLDYPKGSTFSLSTINTTVHLGAHTDAPYHYVPEGDTIDKADLSTYLGSCQVIDVRGARGRAIMPEDFAVADCNAARILFRTDSYPDADTWNNDFSYFAPETIEVLAQQGVKLVGIDTPSVDKWDAKELSCHKAIQKHRLRILEGIVLSNVIPGNYTLVALPLPIAGGDASPVRAVLLPPGIFPQV